MNAARIVELNEPLQVRELQTPTPEETQVLINAPPKCCRVKKGINEMNCCDYECIVIKKLICYGR